MHSKKIILKSEEFIKQDNSKLKRLKNLLSSKKDNSHIDKVIYSKVMALILKTNPPGTNLDNFIICENKANEDFHIQTPKFSSILSGGWGYSKNDCIIFKQLKEVMYFDRKNILLLKLILSRVLYEWDYFYDLGISVFYPLTGQISKYTIYEHENKIFLNVVYRCLGQTHDEFQIVYGATHDCEDYFKKSDQIKKILNGTMLIIGLIFQIYMTTILK